MLTKLTLLLFALGSPLAQAATCYGSAPGTSPEIVLRWPDRPTEVGGLSLKVNADNATTIVGCTNAQPIECQLDQDLGAFNLVRDGARVDLVVRRGHLGLVRNDDRRRRTLQAAVVEGRETSYALARRAEKVCAKHFGELVTIEFPEIP